MNNPKVMVIDDCEITLATAKTHLEDDGFNVITRSDIIGTTSAVVTEKPDCILLDVSMPGLSGTELAKLINKKKKDNTKIILYSAKDKNELELLAEECGADGYIAKTDDITELAGKVRLLIRR